MQRCDTDVRSVVETSSRWRARRLADERARPPVFAPGLARLTCQHLRDRRLGVVPSRLEYFTGTCGPAYSWNSWYSCVRPRWEQTRIPVVHSSSENRDDV